MKQISNLLRTRKLIYETIDMLKLDLSTMSVLTEAASGNFIVTPLIAAVAGADQIYVVSKDSSYGQADEIYTYLRELMVFFEIPPDKICRIENKNTVADKVNIVTNLGHVRPITEDFICNMRHDAAIPLMFESWEFRDSDIDVPACKINNIPILGTKETAPELQIFRYVGISVLKLLLENGIEIFKSHILLVSSGEYLHAVKNVLIDNGAEVEIYNPYERDDVTGNIAAFLRSCDAVVVAEQRYPEIIIGDAGKHIDIKWLLETKPLIIHIAGLLDYDLLEKNKIIKKPSSRIPYGYMTVTTEYAGIRPVIELHAAGLKVGQEMVNGLRKYHDVNRAKQNALENSPAMMFEF